MDRRASDPPGFELPLLLVASFRTLVDALHRELAERGHPDARPLHGFALQAIGPDGVTTSELGRRLGVSKQGAAKTAAGLERIGYIAREADPEHDVTVEVGCAEQAQLVLSEHRAALHLKRGTA